MGMQLISMPKAVEYKLRPTGGNSLHYQIATPFKKGEIDTNLIITVKKEDLGFGHYRLIYDIMPRA